MGLWHETKVNFLTWTTRLKQLLKFKFTKNSYSMRIYIYTADKENYDTSKKSFKFISDPDLYPQQCLFAEES